MTGIVIPFLDVRAGYVELKDELDDAYRRVMESGWYLLGGELESFEVAFSAYVGASSCAGVGSGLDALTLALRTLAVGPGDEVIVPSNTYVATWLAVSGVGATPVPVEPDENTYNVTAAGIAAAITSRTAAILPVHLYGLPLDVQGIGDVAQRHGLPVLYDAAQAHGARVDGTPLGQYGDLVAWSFYPGKNLGAYSDGGAVTSRSLELIARVRRLRNYGSEVKYLNLERGINSRLDELSAAVLNVKLRHLDDWNARRKRLAAHYSSSLAALGNRLPVEPPGCESAWHLYVIRDSRRDQIQAALSRAGVQSLVHYPIPPHLQPAYADTRFPPQPVSESMSKEVLSLPIGPHLSESQVDVVVGVVRGGTQQ